MICIKRIILYHTLALAMVSQLANAQEIKKDTTNGFVEKVMDIISIDKDNYSITFFPTMDYNQEQGLSLGAFAAIVLKGNVPAVKSKYYRPTTLVPSISYSTKKFLLIESDFLGYTKNNLFIGSQFMIYKMPISYYGIGTPNDSVLLIEQDVYTIVGSFLKSIKDLYFVGVTYDLGIVSNLKNNDNSFIYGIDGGGLVGLGLQARIDTRDDILYPSEGILFDISSIQYFGDYSFNISKIDLRYYKSIISSNNILAFQTVFKVGSGDIPFYKLPKLGGQNMLRSINNSNKYINNIVYLGQAEYRRWIGGRFGAVAFIGAGNNLNDLNDSYFKDMIYMYGVGFRFRLLTDDKLNFRFDAGFGNGSPAIFMTIREAF